MENEAVQGSKFIGEGMLWSVNPTLKLVPGKQGPKQRKH